MGMQNYDLMNYSFELVKHLVGNILSAYGLREINPHLCSQGLSFIKPLHNSFSSLVLYLREKISNIWGLGTSPKLLQGAKHRDDFAIKRVT